LDFSGQRYRLRRKTLSFAAAPLALAVLLSEYPAAPSKYAAASVQPQAAPPQAFQAVSPPLTENLNALKRGVDSYSGKQYASALEFLPDEQSAKGSLLGDYILFHRAKSNFMLERYAASLNGFRLLASLYYDSPFLQDALKGQSEALLKLKNPKAALAVLGSPEIEQNAEILHLKATVYRGMGEKEASIQLYLRIYSSYPDSRFSPLAEKDLLSLSPRELSGNRHYGLRLQRAENLIKAAEARKARTLLLTLGQVPAPDRTSSQRRSLLLAEAEYRLGRTATALTHLRKVTGDDSELHARATYLEGACYRRLKRETAMLKQRDRALMLYPLSPHTEELCYSTASYFELNYEAGKAQEAYRILLEAFPRGRRAERARWQAALFAYLAKDYGEAARGFWNYLIAYPRAIPASSAMYWMGRCYENLGDRAGAKYLFTRAQALANQSYYGQRARESAARLKDPAGGGAVFVPQIDFSEVIQVCNGIPHPPASTLKPGTDGARVANRAQALLDASLPEFAVSELQWGSRRFPKESAPLGYLMSRIHASMENHLEAIASLRKIFPDYIVRPGDSLPGDVWDLLFPTPYLKAISSQASKNQIDPNLILALIRQESGFEAKARPRANARGLMQILPSTGRRLARQAGIARYNAAKLYDAETNIILGTRFLASLLKQYGDAEIALAAYNAGGSRADRWLREFGRDDMAEFVERIPFSETRNYIRQVLNNKARYDLLASPAESAVMPDVK
jgi:soluble lytic murein transglycosylase